MASVSKEYILKEIKKCAQDPVYFIKNYCKIAHPVDGIVPFDLFDFQEDLVYKFEKNKYNIILKARQLGISTVSSGYVLWLILFRKNKNVLSVATKQQTAANIVKKVKQMHAHLPEWMQSMTNIDTDNKAEFGFTNGSRIRAESTEGTSGRSEAVSLLVIDEAAHVENLDDLWTGMQPTLSTGGSCIVLSTPNGAGKNWFYRMCMGAKNGTNNFVLTKIMWYEHPDRDQDWFEEQKKSLSTRKLAQEHLCNFNASGETVIDPDDLERVRNLLWVENPKTGLKYSTPILKPDPERNLWVWEQYRAGDDYIITADVARGDGSDFSSIEVLNTTRKRQEAEFKGQLSYDDFAELLVDVGLQYGEALIIVENNILGIPAIKEVKDAGYKNIFYSKRGTHEYVEQWRAERRKDVVPGFTTSSKTRPQLIAAMEEQVRKQVWQIRSERLLEELQTFIYLNGKPQAQKGANDDLVMAFAIGCWVMKYIFEDNEADIETKEAMLRSIKYNTSVFDSSLRASPGFQAGPDFGTKMDKKREDMKKSAKKKEQTNTKKIYMG